MRRGPAVALVAVVAAIGARSASAKEVQVAGPTGSGATLRLQSDTGPLCMNIVVHGTSHSSGCSETPRLPSDTDLVESENRYVGGAAPPEVARVQAVQADGTTTDALGRPSRGLTFFVLEFDSKAHGALRFVRLFSAACDELSAVGSDDGPPSSTPVELARFGRLRAVAYDARIFAPSPIELELERHFLCVGLRAARGDEDLSSACLPRDVDLDSAFTTDQAVGSCGHGDSVIALAEPRVTRMAIVLGTGRHVSALPIELPLDPPQGRRAFVLGAPREAAVRRIEAFDASGRRVGSDTIGMEPATGACSSGVVYLAPPFDVEDDFTTSDAPPAGGPSLAVRVDDHQRVCIGVDEAPGPSGCDIPLDAAVQAGAERRYGDGSRAFAGLVVAGVDVPTGLPPCPGLRGEPCRDYQP